MKLEQKKRINQALWLLERASHALNEAPVLKPELRREKLEDARFRLRDAVWEVEAALKIEETGR